jgi:hypothetical protein
MEEVMKFNNVTITKNLIFSWTMENGQKYCDTRRNSDERTRTDHHQT